MLLPGSLPLDQATLRALSEGLPLHQDIAARLRNAETTGADGSWSDAERAAGSTIGDLPTGLQLRSVVNAGSEAHDNAMFAVASPLSAALGLTDLTPLDPDTLQLTDADSRALCDTCGEHLQADGIDLTFVDAHRWLFATRQHVDVLTERPEWMIGENLRPNLPRGAGSRQVERWMNELQMLLYTHPVNIAREDRGLPPINVIWLWGFSPASNAGVESVGSQTQVTAISDFAKAFRNGDLAAWQRAWSANVEAILVADQIILGDSHPRLRITHHKPGFMQNLLARFARPSILADTLITLRGLAAEARS